MDSASNCIFIQSKYTFYIPNTSLKTQNENKVKKYLTRAQ